MQRRETNSEVNLMIRLPGVSGIERHEEHTG